MSTRERAVNTSSPSDARENADGVALSADAAVFVTTHWSVVLAAKDEGSPQSEQALETLCRTYWYPLYAYVRRLGHGPHDAEDLTQEFFARLLQKHYLLAADPEKGRFRTFLRVALKRFLANEWDRVRAAKRGGGWKIVPLDTVLAERLYARESGADSPDQAYERRWALTLVEQALARLRAEYEHSGKGTEFGHLKVCLKAERGSIPYAQIAGDLGVSESNARVLVHRLRRRFRELFHEEIGHTLANSADLAEEMRYLMAVLAG